jgi:hypothetical protein
LTKAAAAHHAAIERAINGGCTDGMLSIELGISRQAVNQYRQRWLGKPQRRNVTRDLAQGELAL